MLQKLFQGHRSVFVVFLLLMVAITVFLGLQVQAKSRMETDLDKYMPQDHPAFVQSDLAEERFHIRDGVLIAIENPQGIYNPHTITKIRELTKELENLEEIESGAVTSLYSADNIVGVEDGLDVKPFYKTIPETPEEFERLQVAVRHNSMVYGRLVSTDETVAIIVAEIEDHVFTQEFYQKLIHLAQKHEGVENIYVAGRPIVEGSMALLAPRDMKKMVPIVILVIILVLFAFMKSVRGTVATLMVVVLSTVWTFGLMAWIGIPIYAVSTMIPVMLIAIGVADGIHLFHHLHHFKATHQNSDRATAVTYLMKALWKPVVITSLTTAVGFLSLLTSEVYPIKYFGVFTAFGVLVAMILSLFMIPAFIMVFGIHESQENAKRTIGGRFRNFQDKILVGSSEWGVRNPWKISLLIAFILVGAAFGISKVWINSSFLDNFERTSDIVKTDAFVNAHFGGTSTINVILTSEQEGVIKSPSVLRLMDQMQKEAVQRSEFVGSSFSLADYIRRMNFSMNTDQPEYDRIPDSTNLIAQYLLLYEMSGDPENLWKVVDGQYKTANITLQLKSDNSKASKEALGIIEGYRSEFKKMGLELSYAGSGYKALVFSGLILEGQIKSILLSFVIVAGLLALMFRSLLAGLIGTVPILLTAAISFGLMGWFNIALNTTTALLSSIAIGIGIDYAVHFLEQYRMGVQQGLNPEQAGLRTIQASGQAIFDNALVIIAGFLVLLFSVFPPNRTLGTLVSLNMLLSFVATITVMYVLLRHVKLFTNK